MNYLTEFFFFLLFYFVLRFFFFFVPLSMTDDGIRAHCSLSIIFVQTIVAGPFCLNFIANVKRAAWEKVVGDFCVIVDDINSLVRGRPRQKGNFIAAFII